MSSRESTRLLFPSSSPSATAQRQRFARYSQEGQVIDLSRFIGDIPIPRALVATTGRNVAHLNLLGSQ